MTSHLHRPIDRPKSEVENLRPNVETQVDLVAAVSSEVPGPMFTFSTGTEKPSQRVRCHHCGWKTSGSSGQNVYGRADHHVCRVYCDGCGCEARRPAIDIAGVVLCTRCVKDSGMFPGEHGTAHTIEEWRRIAAIRQGHGAAALEAAHKEGRL